MPIKLFLTGGSFDKEYDPIQEKLVFNNSHVAEMFKKARSTAEVETRTLMMIDSLNMTFADRQVILQNCLETPEDRIVIIHGTSTMTETAKVLGQAIDTKTIVLTGAMYPYATGDCDSMFNLGAALAFAEALPPGVYLAMNGRYFNWYNVKKNEKLGLFEEL